MWDNIAGLEVSETSNDNDTKANMTKEEKDVLENIVSDDYTKYVFDKFFVDRITDLYGKYKQWFWIVITVMLLIVSWFGVKQIQMSISFEDSKKRLDSLALKFEYELKQIAVMKAGLIKETQDREKLFEKESTLIASKGEMVNKELRMSERLVNAGDQFIRQSKEFYDDSKQTHNDIKSLHRGVLSEKDTIFNTLNSLKKELTKVDSSKLNAIQNKIDLLIKTPKTAIIKLHRDSESAINSQRLEYKHNWRDGDIIVINGTEHSIKEGSELPLADRMNLIVLISVKEFSIVALSQQ